jgi:hypothetical protein
MAQCTRIKSSGERCRGPALPGLNECVFHAPELAVKRAEGRKQGGITASRPTKVLPLTAADVKLKTASDVRDLLGETISQVRRGQLDPKIGNAVGFLAATLLRAVEAAELEALAQEVDRLRALVERGHAPQETQAGDQQASCGREGGTHRPDPLLLPAPGHADAV